jgi:hypothetical protein
MRREGGVYYTPRTFLSFDRHLEPPSCTTVGLGGARKWKWNSTDLFLNYNNKRILFALAKIGTVPATVH